jgi:hypothetical protein
LIHSQIPGAGADGLGGTQRYFVDSQTNFRFRIYNPLRF